MRKLFTADEVIQCPHCMQYSVVYRPQQTYQPGLKDSDIRTGLAIALTGIVFFLMVILFTI